MTNASGPAAGGLYRHIFLAAALFLFLDLGVLLLNFYISAQLSADARLINIAGRQRMLSQAMGRDAFAAWWGRQEGQGATAGLAALHQHLTLFDATLAGLQQGGTVTDTRGQPQRLAPVGDAEAQRLITVALQRWQPLRAQLLALGEGSPRAQWQAALAAVQAQAGPLLADMNALTSRIEDATHARVQLLRAVQAAALLLALLNFLIVLRLLLRRLADYGRSIEQHALELEAANVRLEQARAAADAASEAKSQFLATMSHEIRTPMNGVIGLIELLRHGELEPDQQAMVGTVHESARALLTILDDILDFSRIEAGKLRLEAVPVDVGALARGIVDTFRPNAERKRLRLALQLDDKLPAQVQADPVRLRQILFNLLSNALKFTETTPQRSGFVQLVIAVAGREGGACTLDISVRDNGIGMSAEEQSRLFQPFSQADASTTRRFGGTGLGLSICRRLVDLMGGEISVQSRPGEGSEFSLRLRFPEVMGASRAVASMATLRRRPCPDLAGAEAAGRLVLVAEDNLVNQQVITLQLEWLGYACLLAEDGEQALRLYDEHRVGLLLTDCDMPVIDGYELTRRIRQQESRRGGQALPVLALTASAGHGETARCRAAGMNDVITKPVELAGLQKALERWLHTGPAA